MNTDGQRCLVCDWQVRLRPLCSDWLFFFGHKCILEMPSVQKGGRGTRCSLSRALLSRYTNWEHIQIQKFGTHIKFRKLKLIWERHNSCAAVLGCEQSNTFETYCKFYKCHKKKLSMHEQLPSRSYTGLTAQWSWESPQMPACVTVLQTKERAQSASPGWAGVKHSRARWWKCGVTYCT